MRILIIIIMLIFGSIEIGVKNGIQSTNRSNHRYQSPLYRYLNKNYYPTQYWPRTSSGLDIQNVATK